jgi:tetratricopeptide (TPR) repeat protein
MDEPSLSERFPGLEVGRKPAINGFTTLSGRRDYDPDTGTYVITNYFCVLSVPVIALGAYRVADAEGGGWYCLGRVPLHTSAKVCNAALVAAVLAVAGGIWWYVHTHSDEYIARQKLAKADEAAAAGQGGQAAKLCREVMDGKAPKAAEQAKQKLAGFIETPPGAPSEAAAVYAVAADLHRENRCPVADLFAAGTTVAARYAADNPAEALDLLEVVAPFAADPEAELAVRRDLLEKLYARSPDDPDVVSRLAAACEAKGEIARCEKLLVPMEKRLGTRNGAAILGRIYAGRGEYDRAHALLRPVVEARLPAYRTAQDTFSTQAQAVQTRIVRDLESEKAPGFDYDRAKRADKEQQIEMMRKYIGDQIRKDPSLREARAKLIAESPVVNAALDLGLVQLRRGQAMADPAARKAELEAAEKTFLSISGVAGEDDEYRLRLGRVYHWLGRPADAKKLFTEFTNSHSNATEAVLQVAVAMRDVGDHSGARKMVEDAYAREKDLKKKYVAAQTRAVMRTDLDDEIVWLGRADPDQPAARADLANAHGRKAAQDGKYEEAADHFRKAIEIYEKLPETAASLNNGSIGNFSLFRVSQDKADFTRGMDKLDRAIALQPSDSILLANGASAVAEGAVIDTVAPLIDFRALKLYAGRDALPYLYRTAAERDAVFDKFLRHPGIVKSRAYAEKLLTLAAKSPDSYAGLSDILDQSRDVEALKALLARLERADLDLGDEARESADYLSGKSDARKADDVKKVLARASAALAAARGRKDRTFAYAAGRYVLAQQGVWAFGEKVEPDELVKLAEEAHAAAPSDGTISVLAGAVLFRAHLSLTDSEPAYAKLAAKTKRSLGTWLLYHVLSEDGPLKARVAAHPDVKRLAALAREDFAANPDETGIATVILMRAVAPDDAKAMVEKMKANERDRVTARIGRLLNPYSAVSVYRDAWFLRLDGKDAEAKKLLDELAVRGVPLP